MSSTKPMDNGLAILAPRPVHESRRWMFEEPASDTKQGDAAGEIADAIDQFAERVCGQVWRTDFSVPGFCLLETGPAVDSHALRATMVALKESLSEIHRRWAGPLLSFRSLGRFDQQESTKFHLDGAPDQSLLILGYEPSKVCSRLFLADYTRAAFELGITPKRFLTDFNPMFRRGEEQLAQYVTELPAPHEGCSRILVINNSSLPFTDERRHPLGVMHKAIIVTPDEAERRIVNSMMVAPSDGEQIDAEQTREFVTTETISRKFY